MGKCGGGKGWRWGFGRAPRGDGNGRKRQSVSVPLAALGSCVALFTALIGRQDCKLLCQRAPDWRGQAAALSAGLAKAQGSKSSMRAAG